MFLALLLGELGARSLASDGAPLRFGQVRDSVDQTLQDQFGFGSDVPGDARIRQMSFDDLFESDPELFWRFGPNRSLPDDYWPFFGLLSNAAGLREDHEIPLRKPAGQLRVLFLGDSCTFGLLLQHTDSVPQLVEHELRARYPDLDVECINAGVPAYTLFQGWRFLETRGYDYDPDLVVLDFGRNEAVVWDGRGDLEHFEAWQARQPPAPLRWSRLCRMLAAALHAGEGAKATNAPRKRLRPDEYSTLLVRIAESARDREVELLVLAGAGRANIRPGSDATFRTSFQKETYRFGETHRFGPDFGPGHLDAVPLAQELALDHTADEIFLDHVHPTAMTNQRLAELMVDKLGPWLRARRP